MLDTILRRNLVHYYWKQKVHHIYQRHLTVCFFTIFSLRTTTFLEHFNRGHETTINIKNCHAANLL